MHARLISVGGVYMCRCMQEIDSNLECCIQLDEAGCKLQSVAACELADPVPGIDQNGLAMP